MQATGPVGAAAAEDAAQARSSALLGEAESGANSRDTAKIQKAGRDFESILLGSWLEGAEQSFGAAPGGPPDDEDDGGGGSQFLGMAMQHLAGSIVDAGGIGIARMISEHLAAMQEHTAAGGAGEHRPGTAVAAGARKSAEK